MKDLRRRDILASVTSGAALALGLVLRRLGGYVALQLGRLLIEIQRLGKHHRFLLQALLIRILRQLIGQDMVLPGSLLGDERLDCASKIRLVALAARANDRQE